MDTTNSTDTSLHRGLITASSGTGYHFAEDLDDHYVIFVHQRHSADNRYYHPGDIITFHRVPSAKKPGCWEAHDISFVASTNMTPTTPRIITTSGKGRRS